MKRPLILGCVLLTANAWALDPERSLSQYAIDRWTTARGLPLDAVTSLAQTADGYLWVGTQAGLARFDGSRFKAYGTATVPGMSSDWIDRLLADRRGGLWVATQKEILRFDGNTFEAVEIEGHGGERVEVMFQDSLDRIWVGFDDPGPLRLWRDGRLAVFRDVMGNTIQNVDWIGERGEGEICVVDGDVVCLNDGERTPLGVAEAVDVSLDDSVVTTFPDGAVWICPRNRGLIVYADGAVRRFGPEDGMPESWVEAIERDRHGAVWIRTFDGVIRVRNGEFEALADADGLPGGVVVAWLEDHEGSVWLGTQHGLIRLRESLFAVFSVEEGLAAPQAFAVFADADDNVWVSSPNRVLQRLGREGWTSFGPGEGVTHDVLSIWQEPDAGAIWIGTAGGGASRMEGGVFVKHASPAVVLSGMSEADGTVWFGSLSGVVRRKGEAYDEPDLASRQRVTSILRSRAGALWLASFEGSVTRHSADETRTFGVDQGLSGDPVLALYEDQTGTIWAASYGGGLIRLREGAVRRFTKADGLPADNLYAVMEDASGVLWLTTPAGIVSVDKDALDRRAAGSESPIPASRYGVKDGMRSAECNGGYSPSAARDRRGRLWFPTTDGVVRLDPADLAGAGAPPRVLVETLLADGEEVPRDPTRVALPKGRRNLEIRYAGISFLAPDEVRFRYRLERYDSAWTDAGDRRSALFTRVPPGNYTFEVQAATGGGEWSEAAALPIRVPPRFHETWTFYSLVVLAVALALYGWHRYRLQRALELERVRLRIARDLHDDLGGSLSSISFQSEVARRKMQTDAARSTELIEQVGRTAREAADTITDIVWAVDPRQDDLGSLAARLRAVAGELFDATDVRWEVNAPENASSVRLRPELRRQLYLILKESLNNVARHAAAREVAVSLETPSGEVRGRVRDDGRGFDADAGRRSGGRGGNGLRNMRERAAALGGEVVVSSAPGSGTTLTVRLPLG